MLLTVAYAAAAHDVAGPIVTQPLDLSTVYAIAGFIIAALLGTVGMLLGYLVRLFMRRLDGVTAELKELKDNLPNKFPSRREFEAADSRMEKAMQDLGTRMDHGLQRLFDRLEAKADKV